MIDIQGITKSFGKLQVLKGIDLHIDKGEVVSIVALQEPAKRPCCRSSAHSTSRTAGQSPWTV